MSDLSSKEKIVFERLFSLSSGYVLDFSNRSFADFFMETVGVDIFHEKYNFASGSKANRLRKYWQIENNVKVGLVLLALLDYWRIYKATNNQIITDQENYLLQQGLLITARLKGKSSNNPTPQINKDSNEQEYETTLREKRTKLTILLATFDDLATSTDYQKRGFLLQTLLNE